MLSRLYTRHRNLFCNVMELVFVESKNKLLLLVNVFTKKTSSNERVRERENNSENKNGEEIQFPFSYSPLRMTLTRNIQNPRQHIHIGVNVVFFLLFFSSFENE